MSSKFISILIGLTLLALAAAAVFQYKEMDSFGLQDTLKERFFPSQNAAAAPEATEENNAPAAGDTAETATP